MSRRTTQSVTEQECKCGYLERSANDPDSPIIFDSLTGEYQYEYEDRRSSRWHLLLRALNTQKVRRSVLNIYHCPWCGGAAPESKRGLLFHVITQEEEARLADRLKQIRTFDDAVIDLGPPDFTTHAASKSLETSGQPPAIQHFRQFVYQHLSDVAEVRLTERSDGGVYWQICGKYKGPASEASPVATDG